MNDTAVKFYLIAGVILFLWAVVCAYFPWYQSLIMLIAFLSGVLILVRPEIAVYLMAILVPLFGNRLGFYFDFTQIGLKTSKTIPFYQLFLLFGVVSIYFRKTSCLEERRSFSNPLPFTAALLFGFYAFLSLSWAPFQNYSKVVFYFVVMNFAIYYLVPSVVSNERIHRRLMVFWVIAGIVISVLTVLSYDNIPEKEFFAKRVASWATFIFNTTTEIKYRGHGIGHPNNTSLTLNMAFFITLGLFIADKSVRRRILLGAAGLFILFADLLTASKGGIGSLLLAFYFFCIFSSTIRKKTFKYLVAAHVVVVLLLSLSILYTATNRTPRLLKTSYRGQTVSLDNRYEIWNAGLDQMKRRNLLLKGLGPGGFERSTEYPHAHSHIFSFFFDYGIAGLLFVVVFYVSFLVFYWKFIQKNRVQESYSQIMSLAFIAGTVAVVIHGTIDHNDVKSVIRLVFAMAVATIRLHNNSALSSDNKSF